MTELSFTRLRRKPGLEAQAASYEQNIRKTESAGQALWSKSLTTIPLYPTLPPSETPRGKPRGISLLEQERQFPRGFVLRNAPQTIAWLKK